MRWFNQENSIPRKNEDVLLFSAGNFFVGCVNEKGDWEDPIDGRLILGVSHWMPLPIHPKKYTKYRKMGQMS